MSAETDNHEPSGGGADAFNAAANEKRTSLVSEFIGFMAENKKWWLLPILMTMLMAGALVLLGGTGAAPFIYTLF